ncbi:acetyltransferase (GNAT) family protein [Bradyrhizobium sacchari]|uniref:Acetyltransferase (GNAT) family protein n=2 Tax=Bradyrhizobium sacchari TaxID=1399419 RepID=A0A560HTT3_9BRAD|nr:acetyltransferase (GNAT) family protein [Bradyrhizobium sacchari]TWB68577.1 acetyltransferase (GNAT) family protein [Bradyrhizobium sacchari]
MRGYRPRGWFDIALGWPEGECLEFVARVATARAVSMWHVSQFLIAEIGGKPVAALCAVPAAGTGPAAWRAIEEVGAAIGLAAPELDAIRQRGTYTRACWVQGGEGDWMIEHVATEPAHRGRGLVQALIAHALDKGRAAGFGRATISFLIGNMPAERAYAKAGFAFAEEKRDPAFEAIIGAPGFRMFARTM